MKKKLTMSAGKKMSLEEGCNMHLENCRQRNLREETIRHEEIFRCIIPVSVDLHEPFAEIMRHTKESFHTSHLAAQESGIICRCFYGKNDIIDFFRQAFLSAQHSDALVAGQLPRHRDIFVFYHFAHDKLGELPKLAYAHFRRGVDAGFCCHTDFG